jgi:hypothetical protein
MKRIRRRDGRIVTVADNYILQDGKAIAVGFLL